MTVLSDKQAEILAEIGESKQQYKETEDRLTQEFADKKWESQADLRRLVRLAREYGIPYRQIGIRLETSDHNTIKDMQYERRREQR